MILSVNDTTVLKFLHLEIFIFSEYFSLFTSCNFLIFKRNLSNVFSFVIFSFVTTGNINKQMKTKRLKNEEDILFYGWTLKHYAKTSSLFLFFSRTQCTTEIVSSWSNKAYFQPWYKRWCIFKHIFWTTIHKVTKIDPLINVNKGNNFQESFEQLGGLRLRSRSFSI